MQSDTWRQLRSRYWKPVVSLLVVFGALVKYTTELKEYSVKLGIGVVLVLGLAAYILTRFPRFRIALLRFFYPPHKPISIHGIFRGAIPYTENDSENLPGRVKEIDECWKEVRAKPFLILDGEAGSGKTSLVRSGLTRKASEVFRVVYIKITTDPMGELLDAVRNEPTRWKVQTASERTILRYLKGTPTANTETGSENGRKPLLLIIDQLEQLFIATAINKRHQFLEVIRKALSECDLHVVVVIRSEFIQPFLNDCRAVDPSQRVLYTGNYYSLQAFPKTQAEMVVASILRPFYDKEPLLKTQLDKFSAALVNCLLRTKHDWRLGKTILPVELQIAGNILQSLPSNDYSVQSLKRLGGRYGLLHIYFDETRIYVQRTTGVDCNTSLLILKNLIQDKGEVESKIELEPEEVTSVLEALSNRYIIKPIPVTDNKSGHTSMHPFKRYKLLLEGIAPIVLSAKNNRPISLAELMRTIERQRKLKVAGRWLTLFAVITISFLAIWGGWTQSNKYQVDKVIAENLVMEVDSQGEEGRYALLAYMHSLGVMGKTDNAMARATKIEPSEDRVHALEATVEGLISAGRIEEAKTLLSSILPMALSITAEPGRSHEIKDMAVILTGLGKTQESLEIIHEIKRDEESANALVVIAGRLAYSERMDDASRLLIEAENVRLRIALNSPSGAGGKFGRVTSSEMDMAEAEEVNDEVSKIGELTESVTPLLLNGKLEDADTISKQINKLKENLTYRVAKEATMQEFAMQFIRQGRFELAFDTAMGIRYGSTKYEVVVRVAEEASRYGQNQIILDRAQKLKNNYNRVRTLAAIAKGMIRATRTDEGLKVLGKAATSALNIKGEVPQGRAYIALVESWIQAGKIDQAIYWAYKIHGVAARAQAIGAIAVALTEKADLDGAQSALADALSARPMVRRDENLSLAFTKISSSLGGVQNLEGLLKLAYALGTRNDQGYALMAIAKGLAIRGLVQDALKIVQQIDYVDLRSMAYASLAKERAQAHSFKQAREIAGLCTVKAHRLEVQAVILNEYAKINSPVQIVKE